jgi:hypothetical protein
VHDESTVRECKGESKGSRVQRECESSESRVQSRECRVESTENTRAHSREEGAQCTVRAQSESAEARMQTREYRVESAETRVQCESTEYRVQRVRGHRVERRDHSAR